MKIPISSEEMWSYSAKAPRSPQRTVAYVIKGISIIANVPPYYFMGCREACRQRGSDGRTKSVDFAVVRSYVKSYKTDNAEKTVARRCSIAQTPLLRLVCFELREWDSQTGGQRNGRTQTSLNAVKLWHKK